MTMLPGDAGALEGRRHAPPSGLLQRALRAMSVLTMLMTTPQVFAIWVARDAHNVSLASWATYLVSAFLWLVYGLRKRDRTIYLACIGWIVLDAAIVIGVLVYG